MEIKDKDKGKGKNKSSPYPSYSGGWTWTAAAWSGVHGAWGQPVCPAIPPSDDSWLLIIVLLLVLLGILLGVVGTLCLQTYFPLQRNRATWSKQNTQSGVGVQTTEEQKSDFDADRSWTSESEESPHTALAAGSRDTPTAEPGPSQAASSSYPAWMSAVPATVPAPEPYLSEDEDTTGPALQVPVEQPRGNAEAASSSSAVNTAPAVDSSRVPPPPPGPYPWGRVHQGQTPNELRDQGLRAVATIGGGVCFHRTSCGMVTERLKRAPHQVTFRSVPACVAMGLRPCKQCKP